MALILPGSDRWKKERDPRVRFKILDEAILAEYIKSEPNLDSLVAWEEAREAYRATCVRVLGLSQSRAWDAANNISVVIGARGQAQRYQRRHVQKLLADWIMARRLAGKSVRLAIPKARREGVTTEVSVNHYLDAAREDGVTALVIAQSDKDAEKIWRRTYKFLHANDPLAPVATRANTEELVFEAMHSSIAIRSALGRKAAERGTQCERLQATEPAHWEGDPFSLMMSILAAMPKDRYTCAVAESTGNGQSGWFYEVVVRAMAKAEAILAGVEPEIDTEWEAMFLAWFLREEARLGVPFETDESRDKFQRGLRDDEKLIQQEEGLTLEQMHWYRKLYNDIEAEDEQTRLMLLLQEHPTKWLDCFQAPGSSAFPIPRLVELTLKAVKPLLRCQILPPGAFSEEKLHLYDESMGGRAYTTPFPTVYDDPNGPLYIWKRPRALHRYAMGVDLAESGEKKSDSTEMYVIDRDTEEVVAHWIDKQDPTYSHAPCRLLSKYYNDAIICPEKNFEPSFTENLKRTDRRDFLYVGEASQEGGTQDVKGPTYGWRTQRFGTTKAIIVSTLREALKFRPKFFLDKHVLDQMKTFKQIRTDSGEWRYPGALPGSGSHDDGVIALALAIICHDRMRLDGTGPRDTGEDEEPRDRTGPTVSDRMAGHFEYEERRRQEFEQWG